jgi:hypothetical protein
MMTWVQSMIQSPRRYVHDREIPKVLAEDLMILQQSGILPCDRETFRSNAIPCVASGERVIARVFPKTGIIGEE